MNGIENMSYEQAMDRLQALLETLQDEKTPLAQAIQLYAEAAQLIAHCHALLGNARLEIEEIDARLAAAMPGDEETDQ